MNKTTHEDPKKSFFMYFAWKANAHGHEDRAKFNGVKRFNVPSL